MVHGAVSPLPDVTTPRRRAVPASVCTTGPSMLLPPDCTIGSLNPEL